VREREREERVCEREREEREGRAAAQRENVSPHVLPTYF
jgi:hypothetical protein